MTTTYDPRHPAYLDQADVRGELTRVFEVCHECRRCVGLCPAFPTLFEMIDRRDDRDAGWLTPAEQDDVVDECFHCGRCALDCPYTPELHERAVDVPRLVQRTLAMRLAAGQVPLRSRAAVRVAGHAGLAGSGASLANRTVAGAPGSFPRRVLATLTGVSAVRLLPPYAKQRFSTWFANRSTPVIGSPRGRVTVLSTCSVEYHDPAVGADLVQVYERNGIECDVAAVGCCGAPWLLAGDVGRFREIAEHRLTTLAAAVRRGNDIVVAEPTCGHVLKEDYLVHVGGPDAELVAAHTADAAEHLMRIHTDGGGLDTAFGGEVPATITYHAPCHLRAQQVGLPSRDLMALTGAEVTVVQQCSGMSGPWGLRAGNEHRSLPIARQLADELDRAGGEVVAGDCLRANVAILEQRGAAPQHPVSVVARAYGIPATDRP